VFSILSNAGDNLLATMDQYTHEKTTFEGKDVFDRYTCDAIVSCTFSLQEKNCDLLGIVNQLSEKFGGLLQRNSYSLQKKEILSYIMRMVEKTVTYHERIGNKCENLSQFLMQLKFENEQKPGTVLFPKIVTQTFIFLHASLEILSSTMLRALYELAANQSVQEKTRQDIRDTLKSHGGIITLDAVLEMEYLGQVVNGNRNSYYNQTSMK
jgi:cytochrome P450 family 6